jgi:predicted RecB family nuclease
MQRTATGLIHSATDLSNFLGCPHLTLLARRAALGGPKPPVYADPALDVLRQRGLQHEEAFLDACRAAGARVAEVPEPDRNQPPADYWAAYAAATAAAMRGGADVIYQGGLFDGAWAGRPDFLVRVERPSALGGWAYEVVDTKLAREAKGGALLQVLLYADLLAGVQGHLPEHVHIELGGPEPRRESFRVADYAAYFRAIRWRYLEFVEHAPPELPVAAEPVAHCGICDWSGVCAEERRAVDHLALVAGITAGQRRALTGQGVETLTGLATLPAPPATAVDGISREPLARIRAQAAIQLAGRRTGRHLHELLRPVVPAQGLAALPEPSPGDLFFDLEGDPFALRDGIEYLFGFVDRDGAYTGWWALDRASERAAFEGFIDFVMERLELHPGLHIYHYNHYETTALKRLMGRYGTRERELDRLLRGGVFVDLYRVVRQGLRASVESYSIKELEPFYGYERDVDLRDASRALAHFEAWLELGGQRDDALLERIRGYNRDDCLSTLRLCDWLEGLRGDLERATGAPVPRPEPGDGAPSEAMAERDAVVDALVARLTAGVPDDDAERTPEQLGRWLMAQLLEFHRREKKAVWWEYFRCRDLAEDELVEDAATLGGLEYDGEAGTVARSILHRYRFPPQEHRIRVDSKVLDHATQAGPGTIVELDDVAGILILKRVRDSTVPHPRGLMLKDDVPDTVLRDSIRRVAEATVEHGLGRGHPYPAAVALLLRDPPRLRGAAAGAGLARPGEAPLDAAVRLVDRLDGTVLPIQGPPGAGKTYTAARMIVHALGLGLRVGITGPSHKVIGNLLDEVCRAGRAAGVAVAGIQKADEEQRCASPEIRPGGNDDVPAALADGSANLAAGTAWLWSREAMIGAVDLLFVDEAGQFSLASALAVAPAAASLVLVGDPQQLEQPIQGVHPPGVQVSALDHLLGGSATIPPDRGLFLGETWRLHPEICAYTSEIFYDGRLRPRAGLERQRVHATGPLAGSGLRLLPVERTASGAAAPGSAAPGPQNTAPEEVAAIAELIAELTGSGATWTDHHGERRPLRLEDVLIVAPYNAQVSALAAGLPRGARVGTVDKFQGQEAPIVLYSMTTATPAEAPRGMGFLYSGNRLNVATSRARCLAVIVASPALFAPECRTPVQMRLANAFCRFAELAEGVEQRRQESYNL